MNFTSIYACYIQCTPYYSILEMMGNTFRMIVDGNNVYPDEYLKSITNSGVRKVGTPASETNRTFLVQLYTNKGESCVFF